MSLKKYLKDHRLHLLLGLLAEGVVEAVLWLFASPVALQGFAFFWLTGSIGVIFGYDFLRKRKFYKKVEENLSQLEEKYLLTELLDEPEFLEGQILCRVIQEMEHSMTDTVEQQIRKNGEFKRYIETWIHEIKIPIASTNLILFNHREDMERRMKEQIRRIESYVEQVLYYLRGEVPEKDYCIGGYGLKEIVQSTVRDNKDSLILNGFSVLVELRDEKVYTDRKWLQFMLGQILSNAVKYAAEDERKIRIFTKKVQSSENSSGESGSQKRICREFLKNHLQATMEGKAVLQEWDCISAGDYARNWDIRFWLNQNRESIQGSEFYSGREKRMSLSVFKI